MRLPYQRAQGRLDTRPGITAVCAARHPCSAGLVYPLIIPYTWLPPSHRASRHETVAQRRRRGRKFEISIQRGVHKASQKERPKLNVKQRAPAGWLVTNPIPCLSSPEFDRFNFYLFLLHSLFIYLFGSSLP